MNKMNYIYDIVLNFNENYYEFFEWQNCDSIINVRKIPVIKVNNFDFLNLKYNIVKICLNDLETLKKEFSLYNEKIEGNVICLVTNGYSAIGIMIDSKGNVIKRSSMIFDEENEVIDESVNIKLRTLNYKLVKKNEILCSSRIEKDKKEFIRNFLNNLNDKLVLRYIYYDYFELEAGKMDVKKELLKELNNIWNPKLKKLYNLVRMLSNNKEKTIIR